MPEYIRLDLFPAKVTRGDGTTLEPVRVVVTDDTLFVFQDASPKPIVVVDIPIYDYNMLSRTHYKVTTDDEHEVITIMKRAGCGCGNKLRGFRPFPGVPLLRTK